MNDETPIDLQIKYMELSEGKTLNCLTDDELSKLIDRFRQENRSPIIDLEYSVETAKKLLSLSTCHRCGRCCRINPDNPEGSKVCVSELELKGISKVCGMNYKELVKHTVRDHKPGHSNVRFIKLTCPFFTTSGCKIYRCRPFICCTYPVVQVFNEKAGRTNIGINVTCEYGKDIYRSLVVMARQSKQIFS